MNPVDDYLESLHEGKVWDKVKKVWRDHKGKIIAGAALATAVAGKKVYDKSPSGQARIAKNFEEERKKKEADSKLVKRFKKEDAKSKDFNNKVGATASAAGAVANFVTKPIQYAVKKGLNAVYSGGKAVTKYVGNKAQKGASDAYHRTRLRKELK